MKDRNKENERRNKELTESNIEKLEKKMKDIKKQEYNNMAYSDKNRNAKYAPEYSVLKPETSSDSDSLKSKGARWVSARIQINQVGKKIRIEKEENW